ncbi:hypothetical protein PRIPAC_93569 [Pristionchus pacificus]|uniref:Uncharacterized protein n=1 Tax=Pristionchus pacificus TaxID=54126 RepID=A0A2A6BPR2_PRIPA|nr:hypothetical protein PRIPAC_93569 [Pristionchus pacificus]|eukprot:PDM67890.1 hypothetical protein PRIPAC_45934 [Pristionchus pacificus]
MSTSLSLVSFPSVPIEYKRSSSFSCVDPMTSSSISNHPPSDTIKPSTRSLSTDFPALSFPQSTSIDTRPLLTSSHQVLPTETVEKTTHEGSTTSKDNSANSDNHSTDSNLTSVPPTRPLSMQRYSAVFDLDKRLEVEDRNHHSVGLMKSRKPDTRGLDQKLPLYSRSITKPDSGTRS